jgi:hypothetical protein
MSRLRDDSFTRQCDQHPYRTDHQIESSFSVVAAVKKLARNILKASSVATHG